MLGGVSLQTLSGSVETYAPRDIHIPDFASAVRASSGPEAAEATPARDQSSAYAYTMFLPDGSPCAFVPRTGESVYQHNQTDLEFL